MKHYAAALVLVLVGCDGGDGEGACVLQNPGAESGTLEPWTTNGTGIVAAVEQFDQSDGLVEPFDGGWFFTFGQQPGSRDRLTQRCTLDPGVSEVRLQGVVQIEGLGDPTDHGVVTVTVLDDAGGVLEQTSSGELTTPSLEWHDFSLAAGVPDNAAEVEVVVEGVRGHGSYVNVFFDALRIVAER